MVKILLTVAAASLLSTSTFADPVRYVAFSQNTNTPLINWQVSDLYSCTAFPMSGGINNQGMQEFTGITCPSVSNPIITFTNTKNQQVIGEMMYEPGWFRKCEILSLAPGYKITSNPNDNCIFVISQTDSHRR